MNFSSTIIYFVFLINVLLPGSWRTWSAQSLIPLSTSTSIDCCNQILIIIDPLDEFGNTGELIRCCELNYVNVVKVWSPSIAHSLIAYHLGNESPTADVDIKEIEFCTVPADSSSQTTWDWLRNNIARQVPQLKLQQDSESNCFSPPILAVVSESDTGLRVAEQLSHDLQLRTSNGVNEGRRDKYMMQEQLRRRIVKEKTNISRPLPSYIRQVLTDNWEEAKEFLQSLATDVHISEVSCPFPRACVIKPSRGAASVGVSKATNWIDAERQFRALLGTPGYANGSVSNAVLVQEWIEGVEYAVDTVSRDGEHKVTAMWRYDKRPVNGGPFVYFCTELEGFRTNTSTEVTAADPYTDSVLKDIADYVTVVLDALAVRWGPAHIEVMMSSSPERGPVLIEANIGRFHGQDVVEVSNRCYGYNSVAVTLDAYLSESSPDLHRDSEPLSVPPSSTIDDKDPSSLGASRFHASTRWRKVPAAPQVLGSSGGRIVHLVSFVDGVLKEPPRHTFSIYSLPSLLKWSPVYDGEVGERVTRTVDLNTTLGYALLQHEQREQVDADYGALLELQKDLLVVEEELEE